MLPPSRLAPAAIALGCAGLAMRPPGTGGALLITAAAGAIGLVTPVLPRTGAGESSSDAGTSWPAAVIIGVAAFAGVRALGSPTPGLPLTVQSLAIIATVAVAEEIFFRGLAYGWLARWGVTAAVVGSTVLFAAIHLPAYGLQTLPLNLSAGLLFGWQRWMTGGWSAAAVTHTLANVLILS
jgi:membrane protease YdiL (CAAX protease family)